MKSLDGKAYKYQKVVNALEVKGSDLDKDIGKKVRFLNPSCVVENWVHEIVGIQTNWLGEICYRVAYEGDKFGRPATVSQVEFI